MSDRQAMKDEAIGCPLLVNRELTGQNDGQVGGGVDQDSTLVFCESTSLTLVVTSVLTPLSYTGLSKADSSVMLSYGGEDVGILIVFPCSLQWGKSGKQHHGGTNV